MSDQTIRALPAPEVPLSRRKPAKGGRPSYHPSVEVYDLLARKPSTSPAKLAALADCSPAVAARILDEAIAIILHTDPAPLLTGARDIAEVIERAVAQSADLTYAVHLARYHLTRN